MKSHYNQVFKEKEVQSRQLSQLQAQFVAANKLITDERLVKDTIMKDNINLTSQIRIFKDTQSAEGRISSTIKAEADIKITQLVLELKEQKHKVLSAEQSITSLQKIISELSIAKTEAESRTVQAAMVLKESQSKNEQLEQLVSSLQKQVGDLITSKKDAEVKNAQSDKEAKLKWVKAEHANSKLQKKIDELSNKVASAEEMQEKYQSLVVQVAEYQTHVNSIQGIIKSNKENERLMKEEKVAAESQLKLAHSKIDTLQTELNEQKQLVNDLRKDLESHKAFAPDVREAIKAKFLKLHAFYENKLRDMRMELIAASKLLSSRSKSEGIKLLEAKYRNLREVELHLSYEVEFNDSILKRIKGMY